MRILDVEAFLAVTDELHFGRAAERLHVAQPPVSRAIKRLEAEIGAQLFDRTTRRVHLTAAGRALVAPAVELLQAHQRALSSVAAANRGESGIVRIAFAGASTHLMVGRLAQRLRAVRPGVDLQLFSGNYAPSDIARVVAREVDIGLGRWNAIPAGITTRVVAVDSFVVALKRDHPLASRRELKMADLAKEPFVTLPSDERGWLVSKLHDLTGAAGYAPQVVQEAPDSWTLMALVGAGIGCSLTLASIASNIHSPDVVFLLLDDPEEAGEIRIGWRSDTTDPAAIAVLRIAEKVLPGPRDHVEHPTPR